MSATPYDGAVPDPVEVTDPSRIPLDGLHAMLRAGVEGNSAQEAAIELLIRHDHWLRRRDFLTRCVIVSDRWLDWNMPPMAAVDWHAVAECIHPGRSLQPGEGLAGSASEIAVLTLAASLAGKPSRLSLRELLAGLGRDHVYAVLDATAHANGAGR